LEAVLEELYRNGARPARPGEFTLRAFLAGRIDLLQAEAVLGVIDAHDHLELETALRQLAGGISGKMAAVREELLNLLADLEAGLDFVEEDIKFVEQGELVNRIALACDVLRELLQQSSARMQSTGRRRVVLAGLPNAGKSTLFNALVGREAALVSEVRGTTRDYLRAELDWNAMAIELIDTAGWESDSDSIMQRAQGLGSEQLEQADLIIWCTASDCDPSALETEARWPRPRNRPVLSVRTKCDLPTSGADGMAVGLAGRQAKGISALNVSATGTVPGWSSVGCDVRVSADLGTGIAEMIDAAGTMLSAPHPGSRQLLGMTASRCRQSLTGALGALDHARQAAQTAAGDEIVAIEVREALEHLGQILGTVYSDDILDRIFSKFCIGK
jgi:tRNA modification GTPase